MAAPDLTQRNVCFVSKLGTDDAGYNAVGAPQPRLTIAAALADLAANYPAASATNPLFISIEGGDYTTPAFALPPFTYIVGNPDSQADPTAAVIINLTGNVTLSAGWSVNQTAFGGFANLTFRQTTSQNIDLTLPAPASGNPVRTISIRNIRTDCDSVSYEATSTADVIQITGLVHDGNSADAIEISGGSQLINNVLTAAVMTINDSATIGAVSQAYGIFVTSAAGRLICASTIAAGCTVRLGACDLRFLTLSETAPGVIAVAADAVSIPLVGNITFSGTAVNADLTRTTDSNAIAGGSANGYVAAANNAGNTTVTPTAHNYFAVITVGGAARTSVIILSTAGSPAPAAGDMIGFDFIFPATAAIVIEMRNATAGGTLLESFTTDGVTLAGSVSFVYDGAAWTLWQATYGP